MQDPSRPFNSFFSFIITRLSRKKRKKREMANNRLTEFPPISSPSASPASIPLHLCGVLTGDTVQVQGDTGELQFSVQFKVHRKEHHQSEPPPDFPDANIPSEIGTFHDSVQASPSSSSYLTPTSARENEHHTSDADTNALDGESLSRDGVVTRLRSGVLSPVKYYSNGPSHGGAVCRGGLSSKKRRKVNNKSRGDVENVFDKMLRRRSLPLRPCSSYAFFLTANWGVVKRCSFGEASKRLSKRWYKLPHDVKKEYEEMALKDNARYKRQCVLLKNDTDLQESSSVLPVESN
ncbi:hypothetical protein ABFS83_06G054900 [Erythranthe nasuta]